MKKEILISSVLIISLGIGGMSCSSGIFSKKSTQKEEEVIKEAVLPTDRSVIQTQRTKSLSYSPDDLSKGRISGDWAIQSVNGEKAVGMQQRYIKFVENEKRFYGNNGCNTINGSYTYNASDSTLKFDNLITTMMACPKEGITDYQINMALAGTCRYTIEKKDSQYILNLINESGRTVMTLMHQDYEFLNGTWKIKAIDGDKVSNNKMKLVFDVAEGKVHGNTGCNILNGSFETEMERPNAINFANMAVTRMLCPDASQENLFLVALENTTYANPISADKVEFTDDNGKVVLLLERSSDKD